MEQHKPSLLCQSDQGHLSVSHRGLAYAFTFKDIHLLFTAEEVDVFRRSLENIEPTAWFSTAEEAFVLFPIARLNACVYLTQSEVQEIIGLLLAAPAMIKVHQRLLHRV